MKAEEKKEMLFKKTEGKITVSCKGYNFDEIIGFLTIQLEEQKNNYLEYQKAIDVVKRNGYIVKHNEDES